MMESETKIIYHIDDEDTPYLVTVPVPSDKVTLGDFKTVLNKPGYKYFFKSMDDDFGVVKEEIGEDSARLPYFNGRVVGWLVTAESSETGSISQAHSSYKGSVDSLPQHVQQGGGAGGLPQRIGGIGDSRPPSFHANLGGGSGRGAGSRAVLDGTETETETESMVSSRRGGHHGYPSRGRGGGGGGGTLNRNEFGPRSKGQHGQLAALSSRHHQHLYQDTTTTTSSSMMSSDLETTSYWDSDDDLTCSRFSETTGTTGRSRGSRFKKRRRKHRAPPQMNRASSFSSITDSTLSLNIITVTLNMDTVNFLGISIVGQSNKGRGDGGIYVGSIMKGGAVAQDGRIEPGDMILQVNQISLENMSNDEAVKVLREAVQKPGPIKLIVAKCWDPSPSNYFAVPRQEPIRPIDPSAWVAHTEAVRQQEQYEDYGSLGPVPPGMATESLPGSIIAPPWRGAAAYGSVGPNGNVAGGSGFPSGGASGVGGGPSGVGASSIPRMGPPGGVIPTSSSAGGAGGGVIGAYPPRPGPLSPSLTDLTSTSSSINSMLETGERLYEDLNLTTNTDMTTVAKAMAQRDSGLEIRDRMWLKITIPNAFIGSDVVDWLFNHVEGFQDRRDARKYAMQMLKQGFIRHTVNKSSFSEQCYYVMAPHVIEMCANFASLQLDDFDSVSEAGADPFRTQMAQLGPTGGGGGSVGGGVTLPNSRRGYYQGPPYLTGGIEGGAYVPPPLGYTPQPYITTYGGSGVDHHHHLHPRGMMDGGERSGSQDSLNSGSTASGGSKGRKGGGEKEVKKNGEWGFRSDTLTNMHQQQQQHHLQQQQQQTGSGQDSDSTSQAGSVLSASDQSSLLQKQQQTSGRGGGKGSGVGGKMGLFGGGGVQNHQQHQPYDGPASFLNGGGDADTQQQQLQRPQQTTPTTHGPRPPLGGGVGEPNTDGGISGAAVPASVGASSAAAASGAPTSSITTIQARLLQHHLHPVLPPLPPPKPSIANAAAASASSSTTTIVSSSAAPPSYSDAVFNTASGVVTANAGVNPPPFHQYHTATNPAANQATPTCSTFLQPSIKL